MPTETQRAPEVLRALIIDDEPPARRRLRKLLQPLIAEGRIRVLGEAADGVEALEKLQSMEVDLAFLDIQMPELNGFDVLERLLPEKRPVVIFTTAYDTYALRAFEANAVDYLLKPISKDRLNDAVERASLLKVRPQTRDADHDKLDRLLNWIDSHDEVRAQEQVRTEYLRQLSVPYRDRILLIAIDRVVSAEINEGITRIFVLEEDQKPRVRQHVVNYTLDQLESLLPPDRFMRVHRSAIVHLDHVQELIPWFSGRYKLVLAGDHEVIASRERSKQLKDTLMI
ncbi:MAG: LytTR family DNA-binding domain-containing protein [Rhodothermales bacterium]